MVRLVSTSRVLPTSTIKKITRSDKINLLGLCAGGITLSYVLAHYAAIGDESANSATFVVTMLTGDKPNVVGMLDTGQARTILEQAAAKNEIVPGTALRSLFVAELEALPAEVESLAATGDVAGLRDRLHRLDASAGFCGAPGLQVAIAQLRTVLGGERWPREAVDDFLVVCARVCETLATQVASDTAQA